VPRTKITGEPPASDPEPASTSPDDDEELEPLPAIEATDERPTPAGEDPTEPPAADGAGAGVTGATVPLTVCTTGASVLAAAWVTGATVLVTVCTTGASVLAAAWATGATVLATV